MVNPDNICMGCMKEKHGEEKCPYCGFSLEEYNKTRNACALPAYTILNGKYLVGKVLGMGGFGITYLAYDLNLQLKQAIKEYFPAGLAMRDTVQSNVETVILSGTDNQGFYRHGLDNFRKEARNLAKFQDTDGVVSVNDFFMENGTGYLVMEYIDISMKDYLKEHNNILSEQETLRIMKPLLEVLAQIHREGIIHRDISPDNIMVTAAGGIKLIDFGAARAATGQETKSITIQLKHGYAPVEQYQTHGRQGPYTDIYAVCATMYRMLSGEIPGAATNRVQNDSVKTLAELAAGRDDMHISDRVSGTIKKGLAVWAEDRYQSVDELMKDLYGTGETIWGNETQEIKEDTTVSDGNNPGSVKRKITWKVTMTAIIISAVFTIFCACYAIYLKTGNLNLDISIDGVGSLWETVTGFFTGENEEVSADAGDEMSEEDNEEDEAPRIVGTAEVFEAGDPDNVPKLTLLSRPEVPLSSLNEATVLMASISSVEQDSGNLENSPTLIFDNNTGTRWKTGVLGETIEANLDSRYQVEYLELRLGDWREENTYFDYGRPKQLRIGIGNLTFDVICPDTYDKYYLKMDPAVQSSFITVQVLDTYPGNFSNEVCISDILVYGK